AADHDHAAVHPVLHKGRHTGVRFRLGYLRLVVREQEFGRAAVEIVLRAEVPDRDGRVLDVPSWPAFSPRTVPGRLPGFLRPPKAEIRGVPPSVLDLDPGTRSDGLHLLPAELPPPRESRRVEVHALALRDAGVSV